jgi:hypothetical protein
LFHRPGWCQHGTVAFDSPKNRLGYLIQMAETGRYRLDMDTFSLGRAMLSRLDARQVARPLIRELAAFSGASISMGAHSARHVGNRRRLSRGDQ